MELRLDRLLTTLREHGEAILAAIDTDPLLLKRTSGDLVLANASQALYTPQMQHQLYAKGIVYRRDPYRLLSLPLIKIYNVGERDVTVAQLSGLTREPHVQLRFLRKLDGTLIQVFRAGGRVWFTTRGMIEGARWRHDEQGEDRAPPGFDYLAEARRLAQKHSPQVLDESVLPEGKTLLFEMIHPGDRKVTNYGDLTGLFLLAIFDHARFAYLDHDQVRQFAETHSLGVVNALTPAGTDLAEQMDSLLTSWAGTDEEGCVLSFEQPGSVLYRIKLKSPEYLQLMRLMAFCTFENSVEFLDARPHVQTWEAFEAALQEQGRDRVPEEVLVFYRQHWERFQRYLQDVEQLRQWAEATRARIDGQLGGVGGRTAGEYRKAFAEVAKRLPFSPLLFAALDGRLDRERVRKLFSDDGETKEALTKVGAIGF